MISYSPNNHEFEKNQFSDGIFSLTKEKKNFYGAINNVN